MSARVESPQIRSEFLVGPLVLALVAALTIGALAGSLVTRSIVTGEDGTTAASAIGANARTDVFPGRALVVSPFAVEAAVTWDAQKLDAMAGRVLYHPVAANAGVATTAKPVITQPRVQGWDKDKLEAMAGRVLAAGVGAEDPPVKPHIPKRPPR